MSGIFRKFPRPFGQVLRPNRNGARYCTTILHEKLSAARICRDCQDRRDCQEKNVKTASFDEKKQTIDLLAKLGCGG